MNDMTAAIAPKSDQINADDLIPGPMTITITDVAIVGGQEQPVSMKIAGNTKVYRPCKSMSRVLVAAWGADAKAYVGRSLTLYRDPTVLWGGLAVGGIRISHMSHIDQDLALMLTMSKAKRAPHRVRPLVVEKPKVAPAAEPPADLPDHDTALYLARKEAALGTNAFREWWASDTGKVQRGALTADDRALLKTICDAADAAKSEDPFGLPPLSDHPTPEAMLRAEAEALAAFAKEDGR